MLTLESLCDWKFIACIQLIDRNILLFAGPFWKDQRRFILKTLKDYGFGKKSEISIQEEARGILSHISEKNDQEDDFYVDENIFNTFVVNVIWKIVASKTFSYCEEDLKFVESLMEFMGKSDRVTSIPFFGKFTSAFKLKVKQWKEIRTTFLNAIEEHEITLGNKLYCEERKSFFLCQMILILEI